MCSKELVDSLLQDSADANNFLGAVAGRGILCVAAIFFGGGTWPACGSAVIAVGKTFDDFRRECGRCSAYWPRCLPPEQPDVPAPNDLLGFNSVESSYTVGILCIRTNSSCTHTAASPTVLTHLALQLSCIRQLGHTTLESIGDVHA